MVVRQISIVVLVVVVLVALAYGVRRRGSAQIRLPQDRGLHVSLAVTVVALVSILAIALTAAV